MQFWCCLRLHSTIQMSCCVSHLLIDKDVYVTPENSYWGDTMHFNIHSSFCVCWGKNPFTLCTSAQINYQHKGLTKSLKKSVKVFPLMSMAFNHVMYYCSKTENFFNISSQITYTFCIFCKQITSSFVSLEKHTEIWQESRENRLQGSLVLIHAAS